MKIIIIILAILAILAGYYLGDDVESFVNGMENVDWGIIFQLIVFWAIPALLPIIGIIWLVGFLFKISRKLDD